MLTSALLLGVLRAYAQEPAVPAAPAPTEEAEPVLPIAEAASWVEERGTAGFDARLSSLARATDGSSWLLGLEDGSIYRSMDGARTWMRVLRAPADREADEPDEEKLLLEGEAVLREETQRAESQADSAQDQAAAADTETSVVADPSVAAVVDAGGATSVTDGVSANLDEVTNDTLLHGHDTATRGATVWFDPVDADVALSGRADGIWRSTDGGLHWSRVDPGADAWRFLAVPSMGILVAGTSSGVRVSPDAGARWFDAVDVTDGLEVRALTVLGDQLIAGTAGGLYASRDALRWTRLPYTGAVTGLLADPGWPGGLWVAGPDGLHRTDDGGHTFYVAGRQVMPGLRGLAALRGQGHLATWGEDGVWESMDGGVTWRPVFRGLRDPDVRDLVVVRDQPLIAASRSVWRLGLAGGGPAPGPSRLLQQPIADEEQQLLGVLVGNATQRTGLREDVLSPKALYSKRFLPNVSVEAGMREAKGRTSQVYTSQTVENADSDVTVRVALCFGGCGSSSAYDPSGAYDPDAAASASATPDDLAAAEAQGLYVVNGEVVGQGDSSFAALNTEQNIRKYRGQVSDQVVGAWTTVQRLSHTAPPPSLAGAVARLLDIQEAEARLDLYTEGAYTRARTAETVK